MYLFGGYMMSSDLVISVCARRLQSKIGGGNGWSVSLWIIRLGDSVVAWWYLLGSCHHQTWWWNGSWLYQFDVRYQPWWYQSVPDVFKEDIGGKICFTCSGKTSSKIWVVMLIFSPAGVDFYRSKTSFKIWVVMLLFWIHPMGTMQYLSSDADVTVHLVYRGLIRSGKY